MHKFATSKISHHMRQRGKSLRSDMTYAEIMLWQELKNSQLNGLKFRRQQPIDRYVADFFCAEKKLVIEIDGSSHDFGNNHLRDQHKQNLFESLGYKTLRFSDADIRQHLENVLMAIANAAALIPTPKRQSRFDPPARGGYKQ